MRRIPNPGLEEAITAFAESLQEEDLSTSTQVGYCRDIQTFFAWYRELEPQQDSISGVRTLDLGAYRSHLLDVEIRAASTVNRKLQALRKFFRFARKQGWRGDNPAERVRTVRTGKALLPRGLNKKEVQALLRAAGTSAHGHGHRNLALAQLGIQAGLRVSEMVRLVGGDLKLRERSGEVRVRDSKGHRSRVVPLNAPARRVLRRYLGERGEPGEGDVVFLSERGSPLSKRAVQHAVTVMAARAGIDRIVVGPHTLRHTFALRYLAENPGDLVGLAQLLGHESLDTTAIYVQPSREDLARRLEMTR